MLTIKKETFNLDNEDDDYTDFEFEDAPEEDKKKRYNNKKNMKIHMKD